MPERLFQCCIPTRATKVPDGPDWFHEIKHDGYRLIVQREGDRVRLFTRSGFDWSERYPRIVAAAKRLRTASFVIDGEAVILQPNGTADFDALHSRQNDDEVRLIAFDLLAFDGADIREQPLHARKTRLKKLISRTGGKASDEAQARDFYFDSRANVENAWGTILASENAFRKLLINGGDASAGINHKENMIG